MECSPIYPRYLLNLHSHLTNFALLFSVAATDRTLEKVPLLILPIHRILDPRMIA
jgi:hypothetical protein